MHFRVLIFVILATSRPQEENTAKYQARKYYESVAEKGHRKERKRAMIGKRKKIIAEHKAMDQL